MAWPPNLMGSTEPSCCGCRSSCLQRLQTRQNLQRGWRRCTDSPAISCTRTTGQPCCSTSPSRLAVAACTRSALLPTTCPPRKGDSIILISKIYIIVNEVDLMNTHNVTGTNVSALRHSLNQLFAANRLLINKERKGGGIYHISDRSFTACLSADQG